MVVRELIAMEKSIEILEDIKKCKKCGKVILASRKNVKYCSEMCRTRDSALRQYNKLKDDNEYKKKRDEKNKKYYEEHKDELQARMRVYGMKYYFKKRDEKKKLKDEQNRATEGKNE